MAPNIPSLGRVVCTFLFTLPLLYGGCGPSPPVPTNGSPKKKPTAAIDYDGDGVTGEKDKEPYVADCPGHSISVVAFKVGLSRESELTESEVELSASDSEIRHVYVQGEKRLLERTTRRHSSETVFGGDAFIGAGPYVVPVGVAGSFRQRTQESSARRQSVSSLKKEHRKTASERLSRLSKSGQFSRIGPKAGYLQLTTEIAQYGHVAFGLEDFGINVLIDGDLWGTFTASKGGLQRHSFRGLQSQPYSISLTFKEINTQRIQKLIAGKDDLEIAFEVLPSSVRYSDSKHDTTLAEVHKKCASIDMWHPAGGRRRYYISTYHDATSGSPIPLSAVLKRLPHEVAKEVTWANGSFGDYLSHFAGERGVDVLLPGMTKEGVWLVTHNGQRLDGAIKERQIAPGDRVALEYVRGSDYWRPDAWAGYVAVYDELRHIAKAEQRFWNELYQVNKPNGPTWDALKKKHIRDEARILHRMYVKFFDDPKLPKGVQALYPHAKASIASFAQWFTEEQFNFPQFRVVLKGAGIWWNVDRKLIVTFTLSSGQSKVATQIKHFASSGETAGEIDLSGVTEGERTIIWKPFDEIEFLVEDFEDVNETLRHIRVNDFEGLTALIVDQPLDRLSGADPSASRIELLGRFRRGKRAIRQDRFTEQFKSLRPRVVGVVPSSRIRPDLVGLSLWQEHHPAAYQQSARIFEELYRSRRGKEEEFGALVRAIVASFRCFDFDRASKLATEMPTKDIDLSSAKLVPSGVDVQYVTRLGKVARRLSEGKRDGEQRRLVARFIMHWLSYLRLYDIANTTELRDQLDARQLAEWREGLVKRFDADAKDAERISDNAVKEFISSQIAENQRFLLQLKGQIEKRSTNAVKE